MKKYALYICILILPACNNISKNMTATNTSGITKDSIKTEKQTIKLTVKKDTLKAKSSDSSKRLNAATLNMILGIWIPKGTDNPSFYIKKATIYYPEHFKSYKYFIHGDSIEIHYDGYIESFAYKVSKNDTLTLSNKDYGDNLYYRKKN